MINIQDLKIGNILQRIDLQGKLSPCVVMQIGKKSFGVEQGRLNYEILDLEECCPIPLADTILKDSGFEAYQIIHSANHYRVVYGDSTLYVSMSSNEPIYAISQSGPAKAIPCHSTQYVHDLQNAFYMATKQQLNIVIK
jgi:hypothetical protein